MIAAGRPSSPATSTADGTFVTAVATTGIYCRPSCAARQPLRQNVRFYATCAEAEAAGFRAVQTLQAECARRR